MKRYVLFAAMFGVMCAATSFGLNVSISGTNATRDAPLVNFITNNIAGAAVTYGDYSNPANIPAGTNIFMIGRSLSSTPYGNATNSATFNALTIPVVCFTSYIARSTGSRWGWHDGDLSGGWDVTGNETTVTDEGAGILGVSTGTVDWFTVPAGAAFWGTGIGSVGDGHILATLGGGILVAGWNAGELSGTGVAFGSNRLLFNVPQDGVNTVVPGTTAGQAALIALINALQGNKPFGTKYILNPNPADGAIVNKDLLTQLNWTLITGLGIYKCDVYLGTEPNVVTMDKRTFNSAVESVDIDGFASFNTPLNEGTYYWRVDCYNDSGHTETEPNFVGTYWSFIATSIPIVTQQTSPAFQAKFVGETAEFTAAFSSSTTMIYTWYKSIDNANNTDTDDTAVGTNSATLTLSALTPANTGYYYCKATNSGGSARSNPARLSIKRQIAHWTLNGNANDSSGNGVNGTLFGEPNFVDGVNTLTGQALAFDGVNDYIAEPNTTVDFSDFAPGMTITVWAKPTAAGTYARFVDFGNGPQSDNIFVSRVAAGTNLELGINIGTAASVTVAATNVMALNEWQMFAVTMNESGSVVIYKNGLSVGTGTTASQPNVVNRTRNYVGRSNWAADAMYAGSMDDIQIWNYAKTADNVADLYAAVVGNFCRFKPDIDWDNNCKIDIGDFAIFAARWLECGLYPECPR